MNSASLNPYFELIIRLAIDISITWMIIMGIYSRNSKKRSLVFCLFMFNLIIFVIAYILCQSTLSFGAGLGLFGLFTMLRYRSETLNHREMTFLFIVIAIGFINSAKQIESIWIIIFLNITIFSLAYFLDKYIGGNVLSTEKIKYNNIELLKPQYRHLLLKDIYQKTGIKALSVDIESISIGDDSATLSIYYDENEYKAAIDQKVDSFQVLQGKNDNYEELSSTKQIKKESYLKIIN